ncbi:DUF1801 domain-containing protein [Rhodocytophaga aerolata]|uniref:DUF1801 domain-containing protein n=1 Tax=Rhodocytophaga aerolata TaxID=455078 RepID=A0ABT8R020_9BACT|nr:DUF1801 domain-containing protein [Rhodocytophaga aerolata]MDO1445447.1 DUF1801 domain-containing protein [Rhodocytophaga aerolata]
MLKQTSNLNEEVTRFVDGLDHPLQKEITQLRQAILNANTGLTENIKWNGPNYCFHGEDRITMRIQPPKQIQLIFHRGAKVLEQPNEKLVNDRSGLLTWKTNDRAIAAFKNMEQILASKQALSTLINDWVVAAR